MSSFQSYRFNPAQTAGATWFMVGGDEVAGLDVAIFPPPGTVVSIPGGRDARVTGSRLDVSNSSGVAMVYVDLQPVDEGASIN